MSDFFVACIFVVCCGGSMSDFVGDRERECTLLCVRNMKGCTSLSRAFCFWAFVG